MATTCKLIAKNVLGSATSSVTFSDIPASYTDLMLLASARSPNGLENLLIQFNGTTTNYSHRTLRGSGSAAASFTQADFGWSTSAIFVSYVQNGTDTFSNAEIYIPNYAGSTNKSLSATGVQEANSSTAYILATAGLWSNTAAITSIKLYLNGSDIQASSSFFLYGITKA